MVAPPSANAYGGRGPLILGITWTEAALATIAVVLRAYSAGRLVKKAEWDLFWVIVAWCNSFACQVLITLSALYGIGNHVDALTHNDIVQSSKWSWIGQINALFAIGFGKIAVVALLLRIQGPIHVKKGYILHAVWISNLILNINQTIMILLQCHPVTKIWDREKPGNCDFQSTTSKVGFFQGSWAAASDVVLATYPIFVFWSLNLSWKRKVGLCALMGGGYIAAIAGIMKTIYIKLITATSDVTYAEHPLIIWAYTEMWLIIILGSIPQLRVVFTLLKSKASIKGTGSSAPDSDGSNPDHVRKPRFELDRRYVDSTTVETTAARTESESQLFSAPINWGDIVVTNSVSVTHTYQVDEEAARTDSNPGTTITSDGGYNMTEEERERMDSIGKGAPAMSTVSEGE